MQRMCVLVLVILGSVFLLTTVSLVFQGDAQAIPSFARKYKVSCSMCHIAVPKLKPYGEEFAGNGFVLPDGEEPKRATVDTGDENLLLQRDLPLAARVDLYLKGEESAAVDADLQTPYGLKLLSGGRIAKNVSYYFYVYLYERGSVAGLEDAYVHFNDIGGVPFDIMVGQFQVSDPLFKRELRLTFEDYLIYRFRPGYSAANLTYDRGFMLTYGFGFGLDAVGQLLNGNGIPEAENRVFDVDTDKAYSLRLSQGIGPVRFGLFGYYNEERNEEDTENRLYYAGADASAGGDKWEINVQYLHRTDSNAFFVTPDSTDTLTDTETDGGLVELIVMPWGDSSRWVFLGLYNLIDSDGDEYDTQRATVSVSHLAARNLRFLLEYTRDIELKKSEVVLGAMAAF